jgi:hypothetical protein
MIGQDGAKGAPAHVNRIHLRNLAGWLILVPAVLLILFCSGQISVWAMKPSSAKDVQSQLTANYAQWPYEEVAPMNPAMLGVIRREQGQLEGTGLVVPGIFLPTPTSTQTATDTPTSTDTLTPTETLTPTPTDTFTPSETPTITLTPTDTPTFTPSPTQLPLPPGMNIGPGDGVYTEVGCGGSILVDLGSPTWIGNLVYYEVENPAQPGCGDEAQVDAIEVLP